VDLTISKMILNTLLRTRNRNKIKIPVKYFTLKIAPSCQLTWMSICYYFPNSWFTKRVNIFIQILCNLSSIGETGETVKEQRLTHRAKSSSFQRRYLLCHYITYLLTCCVKSDDYIYPLHDRFAHRRLSFLLRLDSKKLHQWLHRRSLSFASHNADIALTVVVWCHVLVSVTSFSCLVRLQWHFCNSRSNTGES